MHSMQHMPHVRAGGSGERRFCTGVWGRAAETSRKRVVNSVPWSETSEQARRNMTGLKHVLMIHACMSHFDHFRPSPVFSANGFQLPTTYRSSGTHAGIYDDAKDDMLTYLEHATATRTVQHACICMQQRPHLDVDPSPWS